MTRAILYRRYWVLPLLVWTGVVLLSLVWNLRELDRHGEEAALQQARFVSHTIETFRLWNAGHGGVYVPADEKTPPNPYLNVPHRDIRGPDGSLLTMVNPAYMTRKVAELIDQESDFTVRLTSLDPLNPINAAETWEQEALNRFESGAEEYFTVALPEAGPRAHYMMPLVTRTECLQCHADQGYRVGDIRGGLSVAFDYQPFIEAQAGPLRNAAALHGTVWLLLAVLTVIALVRYRRQLLLIEGVKAQQECLIEERTGQLVSEVEEREAAEERLRLFIESSGEGFYGVDNRGRCILINPAALQLLGYENQGQVIGKPVHETFHGRRSNGAPYPEAECPLATTYLDGAVAQGDDEVFWRADGTAFPVEYRSHPLHIEGRLAGAVVTFADITQRKQQEAELKMLYRALEHSPASVIVTDVHGRIEYVNRKFTQVTGYTFEEVQGRNPRLLKSDKTPPETYIRLFATVTRGKEWHGQFLNRKKNGDLFWEEASISPILSSNGEITHYVAVKEDITDRKRLEGEIWHRAHYDTLTGLANRTLFRELLEQGITQARNRDHPLGLLFVDLDGFKAINDTLGHDAGDELLKQVAARLLATLRGSDTAARLGGDEFAVILPVVREPAGIRIVAEKIVRELAEPFTLQGQSATISASVGAAIYPDHGASAEALLKSADRAMYEAKHGGKNAYRCAESR